MPTQHNLFMRRFDDKVLIMTVADWSDFKELANNSEHDHPDLLMGAITTKNIDGTLSISINPLTEVQDITLDCRGDTINCIARKPIWAIKKIN